jgi:single-strand DNA-binding protein
MQYITIAGYLSKDAETRTTGDGKEVTNLNIPVKQGWGDKEQTNWYRVAIWGKRAKFAGNFRKGEFVTVVGELTIGEYNGKPQYEIFASDFQGVRPAPRSTDGGQSHPNQDFAGGGGNPAFDSGLDDDVPF